MRLSSKLVKIKEAITSKLVLKIKYHDILRKVEAHILGYTEKGEPALRVFETARANLRTNEFKIYLLSDIQSITVTDTKFTRSVTKPTDQAIPKILLTTYVEKKEQD